MLKVCHNAGFFSCVTQRLEMILRYFNQYHQLPQIIDSSEQFFYYKVRNDDDINYRFFQPSEQIPIDIKYSLPVCVTNLPNEQQFSDYTKLNFDSLKPFINKYFAVSKEVQQTVGQIESKYHIDCDNLCVLFYRGLAKSWETNLASYQEYLNKAESILAENPNITFLLQSDETEFFNFMQSKLPKSISFQNEITHTSKINCNRIPDVERQLPRNQRITHAIRFLAIVQIMAKSRFVVTYSGNAGLWICLYRGHGQGIYQYLHHKKEIFGVPNRFYDPLQTNFWFH